MTELKLKTIDEPLDDAERELLHKVATHESCICPSRVFGTSCARWKELDEFSSAEALALARLAMMGLVEHKTVTPRHYAVRVTYEGLHEVAR
jgi:hypothetical protein